MEQVASKVEVLTLSSPGEEEQRQVYRSLFENGAFIDHVGEHVAIVDSTIFALGKESEVAQAVRSLPDDTVIYIALIGKTVDDLQSIDATNIASEPETKKSIVMLPLPKSIKDWDTLVDVCYFTYAVNCVYVDEDGSTEPLVYYANPTPWYGKSHMADRYRYDPEITCNSYMGNADPTNYHSGACPFAFVRPQMITHPPTVPMTYDTVMRYGFELRDDPHKAEDVEKLTFKAFPGTAGMAESERLDNISFVVPSSITSIIFLSDMGMKHGFNDDHRGSDHYNLLLDYWPAFRVTPKNGRVSLKEIVTALYRIKGNKWDIQYEMPMGVRSVKRLAASTGVDTVDLVVEVSFDYGS